MRLLGLAVVLSAGFAHAQFEGWGCGWVSGCGGSSTVFQGTSASSNATQGSSNGTRASSDGSTGSGQSSGVAPGPSSLVLAGSAVLVAVAGGIITTVYVVKWQADAKGRAEEFRKLHPPQTSAPSLDAMVLARAWLLANELQLKQDLALGAGPSIDELAGIARISPEHVAHFGRVLQRHRAQLATPREMTPERAATIMSKVGELVMADQLLREDGLAVLAAR
ncbi:MAG: hypothetical protein Q8L48_37465 [Archangium sp.]|nr:hypothetical protein [Archangium sp.]